MINIWPILTGVIDLYRDLERWTGIPDARLEGNIVNRNHDDNLTTKRLQDPRVSFNDLSQESWGGGSITRLGWLTFARSFDDRRLTGASA